jgi:hypothetical protein
MVKLIFGFPVHEKFETALDLYYSIKKFNNNPLVLYSSNQDLGNSVDNLKKVPSKRVYKYNMMHNCVFDMCEVIKDMDFDFFVKLDSDCLFANYGFERIFEKKFVFCAQIEKDQALRWDQGIKLFSNLKSYLKLLDDLELKRKSRTIAGALCCLQIYSKRAVTFIAENIETIEKSKGYAELKKLTGDNYNLCLSDSFTLNLLKDAGFTFIHNPFTTDLQDDTGFVRWRPYWSIEEVVNKDASELSILYHPVKRDLNDPFRKYVMEKIKLPQHSLAITK